MLSGRELGHRFADSLTQEAAGVHVVFESKLLIQLCKELLLHIVEVSEDVSDVLVHVLLYLLGYGYLHEVVIETICHLLDSVDVLFLHLIVTVLELGLHLQHVGAILRVSYFSYCFAFEVLDAFGFCLFEMLSHLFIAHR